MNARNASATPVLLASNEPWQKAVTQTHHMFVRLSASAMAAASIMLAPLIDLFYGRKQSTANESGAGSSDSQQSSPSSSQATRDARAKQQLSSMALAVSPSKDNMQHSLAWKAMLQQHQLSFYKPFAQIIPTRSNTKKPQHVLKYRTPPSFLPRAFLRGVQMIDITPCYKRKTLVLDLDETLIRSVNDIGFPSLHGGQPDFSFNVCIERRHIGFDVYKRPYVDFFLDIVSQWYDLIVFTAALEPYGARIADHLDGGRRLFKRHYYRHHCTPLDYNGTTVHTKDLRQVLCTEGGSDLENVIIVDNSPWAYHLNNDNAIPIQSWYEHDAGDRELLKLLPILDALRFVDDVRTVLGSANSKPVQRTSSAASSTNSAAACGSKLLPRMSSGSPCRSYSSSASTTTTATTSTSLADIQQAINKLRTTTGIIAMTALAAAKQQQRQKMKRNDFLEPSRDIFTRLEAAAVADVPVAGVLAGKHTAM